MSKLSVSQISTNADTFFPDNTGEEISAADERAMFKDLADSSLNKVDGGLVIDAETGYSGHITPTSDYSFSTKKFTLDSIAASTLGYVPLAVDGRNANGADQDWGGKNIFNIGELKDAVNKSSIGVNARALFDQNELVILDFLNRLNGLKITSNGKFVGLKTDLLTANRVVQFPDKNITVAGLDDLSGYIPLIGGVTLTGDITVAADVDFKYGDGTSGSSRITPFRSSTYLGPAYNNIVSFVKAGGTELSPNVIAGMWQSPSDVRLQAVDLTANGWNEISVSSAGIGFHTDFSNAYYSYFRADNLTGNKTVQLPNFSGTVALSEQTVNLTGTQASIAGVKTFTDATSMLSLKVLKFGGSSAVPTDFLNAFSATAVNTITVGDDFTAVVAPRLFIKNFGSGILPLADSYINGRIRIGGSVTAMDLEAAVITLNNAVNRDTYIGKGIIGNAGLADSFSFSERTNSTATAFGFRQIAIGASFVNSKAGQVTTLSIGNVSKAELSATALNMKVDTVYDSGFGGVVVDTVTPANKWRLTVAGGVVVPVAV